MSQLLSPKLVQKVSQFCKLHNLDLEDLHRVSETCKTLEIGLVHRVSETCEALEANNSHDLEIEVKDTRNVGLTGVLGDYGVLFRIDLNDHTEISLFTTDDGSHPPGERNACNPENVQPGDQQKMLIQALTRIQQGTNALLDTLKLQRLEVSKTNPETENQS